nr:peritrophin-1-like [Parasteatoda tepidariorum]
MVVKESKYIPSKQCPKPTGIFQNSSNCSTFYMCNGGEYHLQECPRGLHFNSKKTECTFPKYANCKTNNKNTFSGKEEKPKPPPTQSARRNAKSKYCPKMDGIFENEANCSSFYFCVNGMAYLQECPQGLVFDIRNIKCDLPKVVGCKPPPGIMSVLTCPKETGIFRHPTECGTFFLCQRNRAYKYECPEGLVFDYFDKKCVYSSNIKCPEDYLERRKHQNYYMKIKQINKADYVT